MAETEKTTTTATAARTSVTAFIAKDTHERLTRIAEKEGETLSVVIRRALNEYVVKYDAAN